MVGNAFLAGSMTGNRSIHFGITPRLPLLRSGQTRESFRERMRQARVRTEGVILHAGENYVALKGVAP